MPVGQKFSDKQYVGTLTCSENSFILEVIHDKTQGLISRFYKHYDVVWGKDAAGNILTLFNVEVLRLENFSKETLKAEYVLIGAHVLSLDSDNFTTCICSFPYLINWAYKPKWNFDLKEPKSILEFDMSRSSPILSVNIEKGTEIFLWPFLRYRFKGLYHFEASQKTTFNIESLQAKSINSYLKIIREFAQFFSLAQYCRQRPNQIEFKTKPGDSLHYILLFKIEESTDPYRLSLIDFEVFKDKLTSVIEQWHSKYEQLSPIVDYLIRSLNINEFSVPDFLIIAQALDGYHKRFVNKKDGRDIRKYSDQLKVLLDSFRDIEAIQECHIDSLVVTHSRHKYAHLIPDDEVSLDMAVSGDDLFWLTVKCRILLTCCILDLLGFTKDEINYCCQHSRIKAIVQSLPF